MARYLIASKQSGPLIACCCVEPRRHHHHNRNRNPFHGDADAGRVSDLPCGRRRGRIVYESGSGSRYLPCKSQMSKPDTGITPRAIRMRDEGTERERGKKNRSCGM